MQPTTWWWILAGGLVVAELLSGTFYLLMLALGAAAGGTLALLGAGLSTSLVGAALVGGGAALAWHLRRAKQAPSPNAEFTLDVGHLVHVTHWEADGSSRVPYRGSTWTARLAAAAAPRQPGPHRIVRVDGSQLIIERP